MKQPNPIDVYVGQRVRGRRMSQDVSQESLGKALGLTFQQVQKYEKGANRISASRLQQISQFLGAPVSYFFEGLPSDGSSPTTEALEANRFLATKQGAEIATRWAELDEHARDTVLQVVRVAAGHAEARAA